MNLERIVVTGTATGGSKMKQSLSISTLEADQIAKQAPTSAAEILRSIPGIRSESSGGEGNANLTVRGVPISAGGARYVLFQEDGLPVLMFGDIAFGTSDQFIRADYNLDHLEVVRGGSASTLATNSPGGLINFISKDGSNPGGAVGLTLGVDGGRQTRIDFDYAGKLGDKTRFHIGGFNRIGMKRGGFASSDIDLVREMYGIIVRSRLPFSHRVAQLEKLAGSPLADEFLAFVKGSKRGISTRHGRVTAARSAGAADGE